MQHSVSEIQLVSRLQQHQLGAVEQFTADELMSASYSEGTVATASDSCVHGDCRCTHASNLTNMIDALMLTGSAHSEHCPSAVRDKHHQLSLSPSLSPRSSKRCTQCDCNMTASRTLDLRRNRSVGSKSSAVPFVPWMSTQNLSQARQPVLSWQNGTKSCPQQQGLGNRTGIDTRYVAQHRLASNSLESEHFIGDAAASACDMRSDQYAKHDHSLASSKSTLAQFVGGRRERERGGSNSLLARSSSEAHGKSRTMSKLFFSGRSESTKRVGHMSDYQLNVPMSPSPKQFSKHFHAKSTPRSPRGSNSSKDVTADEAGGGGGGILQRDTCVTNNRHVGESSAVVRSADCGVGSIPALHFAATQTARGRMPPPPPPPRCVTNSSAAVQHSDSIVADGNSRPSVLMLVADLESRTPAASSFTGQQQLSRPADNGDGAQDQGSV